MHTVLILTDLMLVDASTGWPAPYRLTFRDVTDAQVRDWKSMGLVSYRDSQGAEFVVPFEHIVEFIVSADTSPVTSPSLASTHSHVLF